MTSRSRAVDVNFAGVCLFIVFINSRLPRSIFSGVYTRVLKPDCLGRTRVGNRVRFVHTRAVTRVLKPDCFGRTRVGTLVLNLIALVILG